MIELEYCDIVCSQTNRDSGTAIISLEKIRRGGIVGWEEDDDEEKGE